MKSRTLCLIAAAQLLATAAAQAPGDAAAKHPATEAKLHSLQLLLTETIFTRQPLAPGEASQGGAPGNAGSSGDRPFAIVRDAMFEPSGKLTSLIVDAPSTDGGRGGGSRTLPAKSVQWDEATKRWLVGEMSLQWAELPEFKNADPAPTKEPANTAPQRPVMASELLNATVAGMSTGANEAIQTKGGAKARIVWWMSPVNQQLAFAVVGHGEKFLAVPQAALRASGSGAQTEVRLQAAPTALDGAPTVASAMEQPSAAVRQAASRHYGVDVPKWDRAAPAPAKDGTEPKKPPTERTPPPQPQPQPPKYER